MARHYNKSLSYQVQKESPEESHEQNERRINQNTKSEDREKFFLDRRASKHLIESDVIRNKIQCMANKLRRNDLKYVRENDKHRSPQYMPLVFEQIFIQVL